MLGTLLLAACGGGGARPLTAEEQAGRVALGAFSVLPPAGPGWVLARRKDDGVSFGRRLSRTHTVLALASLKEGPRPFASAQELAAFVRQDWERTEKRDARYANQHADVRVDGRLGPTCARYRIEAEDRGAKNRGDAPFLVQRALGAFCYDPRHPATLIHLRFAEHGLPQERSASFDADGERFLGDLRLERP